MELEQGSGASENVYKSSKVGILLSYLKGMA